MLALCVWDVNDDVVMGEATSPRELKNISYAGKKPDKIVVDENSAHKFGEKVLSKNVKRRGLVITTTGKVIFDGRKKSLYE